MYLSTERSPLSIATFTAQPGSVSLSSENTKNYAKKKEISKWAKAAKKIKRDSFGHLYLGSIG